MTSMTMTEQIITIAMVVLGTMATRFLPFSGISCGKAYPKIHTVSGQVPAGCRIRPAGHILS